MKKKIQPLVMGLLVLTLLVAACTRNNSSPVLDVSEKQMNELQISENFNFETSENIVLNIQDTQNAVYAIYAYNDDFREEVMDVLLSDGTTQTDTLPIYDDGNRMLASGRTVNGQFTASLELPSYVNNLYLVRNKAGVFSSAVVPVTSNNITWSYNPLAKANVLLESQIVAVNEYEEFFTIDIENDYAVQDLPELPEKDISGVAYDPYNHIVYVHQQTGKKSLYAFYPDSEEFKKIADLKIYSDRMAFNPADGLLYMGFQQNLYIVDPKAGKIISTNIIDGVYGQNHTGDFAFDWDGQMYLLTVPGLYKVSPWIRRYWQAEFIGGKSLPSQDFIGGLTIDYAGNFWASTYQNKNAPSYLLKYNTETKEFDKVKEFSDRVLHDFTFAPLASSHFEVDSDDDGVEDELDAYPDDPLLAFNNYVPGESQLGTLAFEDLWPTVGDYDFNDLVLHYSANLISNAYNKVKEIRMSVTVANVGGSFINGFGIRLDHVKSSQVESVTGTKLTEGIVETDASGLEAGESAATIIVFDNATLQRDATINLIVKFSQGIEWDNIEHSFNPFIFINKDRARELHLPGMPMTSKANPDKEFEYVVQNNDKDSNFKNDSNLPWAIHIPYVFEYTLPAVAINEAYVYFNEWAETSGAQHADWYKDLPGYRKDEKLETK